jgi:prophage maintenance system killer protein
VSEIPEDIWYPDKNLLLEAHKIMIEKYGGYHGLERGLIVFQKILTDAKSAKGIFCKAAILLRGIAIGRIFKDGNHRTAQVITETFLEANGFELKLNEKEIERFIKQILHYDVEEVVEWLKNGCVSRRSTKNSVQGY